MLNYLVGKPLFGTFNVYTEKGRMIGTIQQVKHQWGWASSWLNTSQFNSMDFDSAVQSLIAAYEKKEGLGEQA